MKLEMFPDNSDLSNLNKVKFGIDPTGSMLHLGHLVPLRLAKKFQAEGKELTIVLGTFTAIMGDPSGKDKMRPVLSKIEVERNADTISYFLHKILDPRFTVFRNGDLFNSMSLPVLMDIVSKFSVQNMLSRNAFSKRMDNNTPIGIHELIVPILQAQDSVHLKSEIEIGGSDQLFNFKIARELQVSNGQKPQVCLMTPIINGSDGRKMSKSLGNCIFFDDTPDEIFGKCMSISDEVMEEWIPLLTDGNSFDNPMARKKAMSEDIVSQLHGKSEGAKALKNFEHKVQKGKIPEDIPDASADNLTELICKVKSCSKTQARRLCSDKAVKLVDDSGKLITLNLDFELSSGEVIKIGKRDFVRVV